MQTDQTRWMPAWAEKRCLLLILLLAAQFCSAQGDINFTYPNDGLSSNTVHAILKDRYGLTWFATDDGLNKFDGSNFTVYRNEPGNKNSLQANEVTTLHEDRAGRLWIGTNGGSVSLYNRKTDAFFNYPAEGGGNVISSKAVSSIFSDYLGQIWVGTFGGLNRIDSKTGKVVHFDADANNPGKLASNSIICLFEDSRRNMWIGTIEGLHLYNRKTGTFTRFTHQLSDPTSISHNYVKTIAEDKTGRIWIGTSGGGLNLLLPDRKSFRHFSHGNGPNALSSDIVFAVADEGNGKLWLGTEEGLDILDTRTGLVNKIKPDKRNKHSLTSKSIRSILIDKQGIYWLGTYQGGINKYDRNLAFFNLKVSNSFDPWGLSAPVVTSFAEYANGKIFIGTDGGGLNLFDRETGLFRHFNIRPQGNNTTNLSILALQVSRDHRLWIGTYLNGVFVLDPASGNYRQIKQGNGTGDLNNNDVFCITEDQQGNTWIGTNGGGVNIVDPRTQTVTRYSDQYVLNDAKSISSNFIRAFEEDKNGDMWIGTYGAGIAVFHPPTKTFRYYRKLNKTLPADVVLSLLEDRKGNIWAGTIGAGLCFLDKRTGNFISFSEQQGLVNNVVHAIVEDREGMIWVSTNKGISRFDPVARRFKNYSSYNGLQGNAFVRGAGIRLANGELYFGGLEGFNYFDPRNLTTNKNVPAVMLTDFKIANKPAIPGTKDAPLSEHISFAKQVTLDYKQSFTLGFVALNYTTPQQNQYAYKLRGLDTAWNYVGTERTASYTNLDPGEYTFQVKASNNDGIWNEQGTSIKIVIRPPYWRTTYAYLLYAIATLSMLLYIRHRGIKKLEKKYALEQERLQTRQLRLQEQKEAERVRELDLLKIRFLTNLSHEFRTPISLIMGPVDKLLNQRKNQESFANLFMIKRNARRLLNLVNQLLDFRKMEEQELKLVKTKDEIVSFLREASESFMDMAENKRIRLTFNSQVEWLYTTFDHDKLERILFNLLSNAFKFTYEGGSIRVEITETPDPANAGMVWLSIVVADSGIGISKDKQDKIFDRFFQAGPPASILNQGSGIGLSITQEFVKMHGGTIQLESEPGKGSRFIVSLPFMVENVLDFAEKTPHDPQEWEDTAVAAGEPIPASPGNLETPHILLVEDNTDFRFYLKDNLKSLFKISEAENGKEGWQKALSLHPQLIVSDINMPIMDGTELCRKIKSDKRTSHIPVILLTALTGEEEELRGLETGANDYLTKPFNFEILTSKIRNLLVLKETFRNTFSKQLNVKAGEIEVESEEAKFIHKVVVYIESNLTNPQLSVEDLSKYIGMSRGSLYRKLLDSTGETPVEFIRSVKLEKARLLLEKSDLNIAQICYTVGFSTPNYFAKAFKAKYNMLPSEYLHLKRVMAL